MMKAIISFMVLFAIGTALSAIMLGGGGLASTQLNGAIAEDGVMTVDSTTGFLDVGVIFIGDEKIAHTGITAVTFTGLTRGYEGTEAAAHLNNAVVYCEDAGVLNYAAGYNIATSASTAGLMAIPMVLINFFTITVPRLMTWNFAFLEGDLQFVGTFFTVMSTGFLIMIFFAGMVLLTGVFRR